MILDLLLEIRKTNKVARPTTVIANSNPSTLVERPLSIDCGTEVDCPTDVDPDELLFVVITVVEGWLGVTPIQTVSVTTCPSASIKKIVKL